jgi:uncharacterized metal-binding protein YceD (DUF177 family)
MASDPGLTPPWSVPVRVADLRGGLTRKLEADAATRARIARALDLQSLGRLEAEISVSPHGQGWEVRGRILADLAQTCGITLEALPAQVDASFVVRCAEAVDPAEVPREIVVTLEEDDPPDLIEDGVIDLGAYVVEHLALELDPFPRKPGVEFEPPEAAAEPSPFAVLARLKPETDA